MRRATGAAADVLERAVPVVLAGWFIASVLAQHPDRSYDRIRKADKTGSGIAIPNWRFFAPNPSVEDQHFLYRLANEDKSEHTEWRDVYCISPRKMIHTFWFPGRRFEKAVFDVTSALFHSPGATTPRGEVSRKATRRLINEFVRHRITPEPGFPYFQVLLVRYSGYDHSEDPQYDMVFGYESVNP
ncbi:hypothetical protein ACQEVY_24615 [Streptomyces sp. CA-288835]|uniref:hypothetical protein n=1 Tax=Streptomyces sp. CA-288835 TaxID=3240069 RepID=UPI003D8C3C89